jgi:predicted transcriptional regulator
VSAQFAIALGLGIEHARQLVHARGLDLARDAAVPVGLGCQRCTRQGCPQRSAPPSGHRLIIDNQERGLTPFAFAGD